MSNTMRVGGLATGMDLEQIIGDLMKAQRTRLESYNQKITTLAWKQQDYRSINTKLTALRDATSNLRLQRSFLTKQVSSTNESIATATATATSGEVTLDLEVTRLASAATKVSAAALSADPANKVDSSLSLWSQKDKFADQTLFTSQAEGDSFNFSINGETFTVENTMSLDTIISIVNRTENAGVTMYYDSYSDKVSFTSKTTGDNKVGDEIVFGADLFSQNLLQMSGVTETGGLNAQLKINGLQTERTENVFTVDGITVALKGTTPAGSTVKLEVHRDTEAILDAIKGWVDSYNSSLDAINAELNEVRYRDYKPLTQDQMDELTERQIDQWEEKAKSGLLKNDSAIQSEMSRLRSAVYSEIEGAATEFSHLSEIGISTGLASYGTDGSLNISADYLSGKLAINEDKLRAAIEADPDKVMVMFTNTSDVWEEKGVAVKAYEVLGDAISHLTDIAGTSAALVDDSFVSKQIRSLNDQIDREEDRLQQVENRYWRQYTALEKAINQLNSQSAWLNSQFNMGMGGQ